MTEPELVGVKVNVAEPAPFRSVMTPEAKLVDTTAVAPSGGGRLSSARRTVAEITTETGSPSSEIVTVSGLAVTVMFQTALGCGSGGGAVCSGAVGESVSQPAHMNPIAITAITTAAGFELLLNLVMA
ncbi:MAG: hypothetical protein GWN73_21430 [Actinobacteria bacterium]|nr:hypothetical protein [Actinomycetota bacterium]NIU67838.1 hypothetical protein [Actinomycetota bacterium]NIW29606.1 hypothetical protein [Actinomycetota bacterium]